MHQRGAASLHLATCVAMLKRARHRSSRFDGVPTAVPQRDDGPRRGRCQELKISFIVLIYQAVTSRNYAYRPAVYGETEATAAALRSRALARLDRRLLHPFYLGLF